MKIKEFNELKNQVKAGNIEGINQEVISSLTKNQAQLLESTILDNIPLNAEVNKVLDELVVYIDSLVQAEKVANKKVPEKPAKTEVQEPAKKGKDKKPFNKVNIGSTVRFRVEGEEIEHNIFIIYKGKNNIIAVMEDDEQEVFNIRKSDFNKLAFNWTDRHGENYNIMVTL